MTESILIRPVEPGDADGFHSCLDSVAREGLYLAKNRSPGIDRVRAMIRAGRENGVARMVAVYGGGEIVGWCDGERYGTGSLKHRAELGMGVHADFRGRGLGRRLLDAFLSEAARLGVTRVDLEVREDNAAALALYDSCGFAELGRRERGINQQGRYHRLVVMEWLTPGAAGGGQP